MSRTKISEKNKYWLWVKSAGRCEYRGCNKKLYEDILTKRTFNQSYIAHIVADKEDGPRGDEVRSKLLADDLSNLMLLCDSHHRLVDIIDVDGHPEVLLKSMKQQHEERIERLTDIADDMESHIITYKANVGAQSPVVTYESVRNYILPERYPALNHAIDLGLDDSPFRDKDDDFWSIELRTLDLNFKNRLLYRLRNSEIKHMSIFAFAPMPLLIKLGTYINDVHSCEIFQPIRNPKSWKLLETGEKIDYKIVYPKERKSKVALNISLSATIENTRIFDVLGDDCSIYKLSIDVPFNDFLRTKEQLQDFSSSLRKLFDQIKSEYGSKIELNIFPAMPIATAIEMGRVWMPKADMPLNVFDENTVNGGFKKVLTIRNE